MLSIGLPGLVALVVVGAGRLSPALGRALHLTVVAVLVAAIGSQILAKSAWLAWPAHFAVACAAGMACATAYARWTPLQTFLTVLGAAVIAFPVILLLHPSMAGFLHLGKDQTSAAAVAIPGTPPPIVVVILDQLPITSLMTSDGQLDAGRLPGFAALAADATWYRNASTVAELTGWAIPPILSGRRPRPGLLPVTRDYPNNLFTLLGDRYRMEVEEPITDLCPERLCPSNERSVADTLVATTIDAAVVYLHVVLPDDLRTRLPPLTRDWKNFLRGQQWQRRWVTERDQDRRVGPRAFIDGISAADAQPTLYYLHALLPHEPYMYLPSGQQFTDDPDSPGLFNTGRWTTGEWPVVQGYRRHLIQVGFVDALVGRIVEKLKREGLWDAALVVVTADHGVSFRPGHPLKGLDDRTLPDIMAVPLFVKRPGQHGPALDDRNVQSIDVLPTIADVLGARLPWTPEGRSLLSADPRPTSKRIQHVGATRSIEIETKDLAALRADAVARREQLFGRPTSPDLTPEISPHKELIGRAVADLDTGDTDEVTVVVTKPARYAQLNPDAAVLPVLLSGQVVDGDGHPVDARLAVAVNGVIRATTETYGQNVAPPGTWTAFVAPRHWKPGRNDISIFVINDASGQVRLDEGFSLHRRPEGVNLASRGAAEYWSVTQSGLWRREGHPVPYRWTNGNASLVVPLAGFITPRSLRIGLRATRPGGTPLRITYNGCALYDGPLDQVPWYRTFPLGRCSADALSAATAHITIESTPYRPNTKQDQRTLGVGIATLNLFSDDWPPDSPEAGTSRASLGLAPSEEPLEPGDAATIALENRGTTIWLGPDATPDGRGRVALHLTWQEARTHRMLGEAAIPAGRTYYPGDHGIVVIPTRVPGAAGNTAYEMVVEPVDADGRPIQVEKPLRIALGRAPR